MEIENNFFKDKFIDYYNIDIKVIDKLVNDNIGLDGILSISISDYQSNIILSSKNIDIENILLNNDISQSMIKNSILLNQSFNKYILSNTFQIQISQYIKWERDIILYVIFNIKKTNIALAKNRIEYIILELNNILNFRT